MQFYVYILYNDKHDKFYIGQTYNLEKRIFEHTNKLSVYTARYDGVWRIVHTEQCNTRSDAMNREKFLKRQKNKNFYKKLCNISNLAG